MADELAALRAENAQLKGQVSALKWVLETLQRQTPVRPPQTWPWGTHPVPSWPPRTTCGGDPAGQYRSGAPLGCKESTSA